MQRCCRDAGNPVVGIRVVVCTFARAEQHQKCSNQETNPKKALPLTNRCPRHVNQSISFPSSQVPSTLLTSPAPHQVASKIPRTINTINTSEHWKVDDDHHYRCNVTTHAKRKRPQRPQRQRQPPPAPKKKNCVTITRRTRGENKQKKKD